MKIIKPYMVNWTFAVEYGFRNEIESLNFDRSDYTLKKGRTRAYLKFSVLEKNLPEFKNMILSNFDGVFTVVLPIFPRFYFEPDTSDLIGLSQLDIKGNFYNRYKTFYSDLETALPRYGVFGMGDLVIYNSVDDTLDINKISYAKPIAFDSSNSWQKPIEHCEVNLENPISISVKQSELIIYNMMTARLKNIDSIEMYTNKAGKLDVEFEQIFDDEVV